jgi:TadE-like protein
MKAQGMVEMALVTPVLIFFLIGVFELGWLLRGYLILANANREAARYAVRTNVLHFDNIEMPEYEKVVTQTLNSLSGQLPIDFKDNGTMIISFIHTSIPCTLPFTITSPINVPTYTAKFPITSTKETWIDYQSLITDLVRYQHQYSCQRVSGGALTPLDNDVLIVEMFYSQPQLFGFPIISNPLTDPVPLYTSSTFRRIQEFRN